jgi:hypothetical protein
MMEQKHIERCILMGPTVDRLITNPLVFYVNNGIKNDTGDAF